MSPLSSWVGAVELFQAVIALMMDTFRHFLHVLTQKRIIQIMECQQLIGVIP